MMTPRELMETLVEHEDTMIDALSLSLRNIRFGKGEFAFFMSNKELVAVLNFLVGQVADDEKDVLRALGQIRNDYRDEETVHQDSLTRMRVAVTREIRMCLRLLANIDKAKESVEFQEMWKEKRYGNGEEKDNSDEEV